MDIVLQSAGTDTDQKLLHVTVTAVKNNTSKVSEVTFNRQLKRDPVTFIIIFKHLNIYRVFL